MTNYEKIMKILNAEEVTEAIEDDEMSNLDDIVDDEIDYDGLMTDMALEDFYNNEVLDEFNEEAFKEKLDNYGLLKGDETSEFIDDLYNKYMIYVDKAREDEDLLDDDEIEEDDHFSVDEEDDDINLYDMATCAWCGEKYPEEELHKEKDMGYICDRCKKGIESRGEHLDFKD